MESYDKKADEYYAMFGEDFPLAMVMDIDKALEMIDKCLKSSKRAAELYPDTFSPSNNVMI